MGSQRADAPAPPGTRRALREAELAGRRSRRAPGVVPQRSAPVPGRWLVRSGVLAALAGVTIVLPLTDDVEPGGSFVANAQASAAVTLPGTVEALTSVTVDVAPPASIALTSMPLERSGFSAASRSEERVPLPGCVAGATPAGANGQLDPADLCTVWGDGTERLRADAAIALAEMNLAFRARFGRDMCVTDGYRSLPEQRIIKSQRGGLAAVPGRSNHGWGLAIDLCPADTKGEAWDWLTQNGSVYGWENPAWAQRNGSGPYEPWHWEYTRGVMADGEYYTS